MKKNGIITYKRVYLGDYERDIVNGYQMYVHYISGGDGICAIIVKPVNSDFEHYFTYTDHLGSILTVTNASGTKVAEQNFDAWGRKRNVETWDYAGVQAVPVWLYRGYTGHEQLKEFDLINMNARLYDPVLGRMLSPDNFVQGEAGSQGFNRYSYANNNPLKFVDPDGNFFTGFEIVANVLGVITNAIAGEYDNAGHFFVSLGLGIINGAVAEVNPLDFNLGNFASVGVSLKATGGTDGIGFGVEAGVSAGIGPIRFVEAFAGASWYISAIGTERSTLETYYGYGFGAKVKGADNKSWGLMARSTYFNSGETSQRVGGFYLTIGKFKASYENDGFPFGGIGLGDDGDSYRTSSASLGWGDFSVGINLFTGYRNPNTEGTPLDRAGYPYGVVPNPEADKYRAGIFYFGYKNTRVGWNSEGIRHAFQNQFAHGVVKKQPWFNFLGGADNRPYISTGQRSRYHNW